VSECSLDHNILRVFMDVTSHVSLAKRSRTLEMLTHHIAAHADR